MYFLKGLIYFLYAKFDLDLSQKLNRFIGTKVKTLKLSKKWDFGMFGSFYSENDPDLYQNSITCSFGQVLPT